MKTQTFTGRVLVAGAADGLVLASDEPLSFWGGYDQHTGEVIDRRHPLAGRHAAGRILAVPAARGSSTTTAVLLEAIRLRTAPAALLTATPDPFLTLAAVVADELYERSLPVIALRPEDFQQIETGQRVRVFADGCVEVYTAGASLS